jgi:phosphoribosylamine--glycine ligase
MIVENEPYVLEFNVRFGDPETQAILPRMDSDLLEIIDLAVSGKLDNYVIKWKPQACVSVVIASGGYPGSYEKGKVITGLEKVRDLEDVVVFHAGTKKIIENGKPVYLTNGGRVLNVTALGEDIRIAKEKAYQAVELINFENMHYRRDIADKALNRFKINT